MMEVVVTTGAIRCSKLQSKCHHQQTKTKFFTGQMSFLLPNQECQSTEWNTVRLMDKILLQSDIISYYLQWFEAVQHLAHKH